MALQRILILLTVLGSIKAQRWFETPISNEFLEQASGHPTFMAIADQSLPLSKYLGLMQQDDLYVENLFDSVAAILARVEQNETWVRMELEYVLSKRQDYREHFDGLYAKYNISQPKEWEPTALGYSAFEMDAAHHEDLGLALVRILPCYTVWALMGEKIQPIADLPNNPDHIYKEFIESNAPTFEGQVDMLRFISVITYYYEKAKPIEQRRMLSDYYVGLQWEWMFAEAVLSTRVEPNPAPSFTDFAVTVVPHLKEGMTEHLLWKEMAKGTLHIQAFQALLQQDLIYHRGFYEAFQIMESKEGDMVRKMLLKKDGEWRFENIKEQLGQYGCKEAGNVAVQTKAYVDFILEMARKSIHEGLAALYPCYYLWDVVGSKMIEWADLPNNLDNPYKQFIESLDPTNSTSLTRMNTLINQYYGNLGDDIVEKDKMFRAFKVASNHELLFANGVYENFDYC